jgi:hypothetical protein
MSNSPGPAQRIKQLHSERFGTKDRQDFGASLTGFHRLPSCTGGNPSARISAAIGMPFQAQCMHEGVSKLTVAEQAATRFPSQAQRPRPQ